MWINQWSNLWSVVWLLCDLWSSCTQGELNSNGVGRAKGPAGRTAWDKNPSCTCARMPPCAVLPTRSSPRVLRSQTMSSYFWTRHSCDPIKHRLPTCSLFCFLPHRMGQSPGCGKDGWWREGRCSGESGHYYHCRWFRSWPDPTLEQLLSLCKPPQSPHP